jgi:serine/threonine protein kinase
LIKFCNHPFLAIKVYDREENHSRAHRIIAERNILQILDSRYTLKYYNSFKDEKNIYIEVDAVLAGALNKHLSQSVNGSFSIAQAVGYISEITVGLLHIAALGWVHRDLKLSNILLDSTVRNIKNFE